MIEKRSRGLLFYEFQNLSEQGCIHAISTREGGFSKGSYASLNFGLKSGDEQETVHSNIAAFKEALGIPGVELLLPDQCHSAKIAIVDSEAPLAFEETDALITGDPSLAIAVVTADCVPILLHDPKKRLIAAVHAGWKGCVKRILSETVQKIKSGFGSKAENIYAGIGPCISQPNYEVGEEVVSAVRSLGGAYGKFCIETALAGKAKIDLAGISKEQLLEAGLPEKNIEVSGTCTFSNPNSFFSARRDGFSTGRFVSLIKLK